MTLLLLLLGCTGAHPAREVIPEPPPSPGRKGAGPWLLQWVQSNLWVRNPTGDIGYALTRSGRVVAGTLGGQERGWTSVAISPDGRRVAYVETLASPDAPGVQGWSLLWVVNADGTGRRLLVDLRRHFRPQDIVRADAILWSSDGSRVAYTVKSWPRAPRSEPRRAHTLVNAVDPATGRQETLFHWSEGESFQARGWSIERGEFYFTFEQQVPFESTPWVISHFVTRLLGADAAPGVSARGSLSPDGRHLLLLPSPVLSGDAVGPPRWDGREMEVARDFTTGAPRVVWMHEQPVAYLSYDWRCDAEYVGVGGMEPPLALYRARVVGNTPRVEPRQGYPWLAVLDFSPDDAWVLLTVVLSPTQSTVGCTTHASEKLFVAERSRFETSASTEQLLATSTPLGEFPVSAGTLAGFIGWLR